MLPDLLSDILDRKRRTQIHQSSTVNHACVRWKEHLDRHSSRGLRCIYKRVMIIKQKTTKIKTTKRKSEREGKEERNEDLQIEDSKSLFEIEIDTSKIYKQST